MHCLGAVASGSLANALMGSNGNRGSVLSVVRAIGVLVCEGRIQGSSRGYKEGPHCAAPLQPAPNHHVCKKEDYLCNRYFILVKEIADRIIIGANMCVEVFMCCECPCGRASANCNNPVSPIPSMSITQWQSSCEMLLEYWCIGVVSSKSSEMMNSQGLYQAVRSRLHFSQVAAWWSRSQGSKPAYIVTRVVPWNRNETLNKFREAPVKHTFPLASIGDGNSVQVTVWALPRMEEVPTLTCPVHFAPDNKEEESTARALTPTKNIVSCLGTSILVLPALVDDRLQLPCNQSGKHHCRCEDEEGPPSLSIKPNGERKRRRSLPCGPSEAGSSSHLWNLPLAAVKETRGIVHITSDHKTVKDEGRQLENYGDNPIYASTPILEHCSRAHVSLDSPEGNEEKRYKPSSAIMPPDTLVKVTFDPDEFQYFTPFEESQWLALRNGENKLDTNLYKKSFAGNDVASLHNRLPMPGQSNLFENFLSERKSFQGSMSGSSVSLQKSLNLTPVHYAIHSNQTRKGAENGSKDLSQLMSKLSFPKEQTHNKIPEAEGGIINWISEVPGKILGSTTSTRNNEQIDADQTRTYLKTQRKLNGSKWKKGNLELSQREFDEVLAVLKGRTPAARRRTPVKTFRRRERAERTFENTAMMKNTVKNSSVNDCICLVHEEMQQTCKIPNEVPERVDDTYLDLKTHEKPGNGIQNDWPKSDVLLGSILGNKSNRRGLKDISNGTKSKTVISNPINQNLQTACSPVHFSDSREIPFEDEKILRSVLNKRLHRFKQLFKKEQEKKQSTDPSNQIEPHDVLTHMNKCRVKTNFDVVNCYMSTGKVEQLNERIRNNLSPNNSHPHSMNFFNYDQKFKKDDPLSFSAYGNKNAHENVTVNDKKERTSKELKSVNHSKDSDNILEEENIDKGVPSAVEQEQFRRSLEHAASMVFHSRTGLPLTSSPAPLRRGSSCFDYDSSLNSVSSKRSALFELNSPPSPGAVSLEETDRETDHAGEGEIIKRSSFYRNRPQSHALLGNFEESALNGRLEPVSTVHGFTAEIGASGSFCPKHRKLPVTVFFYTLGDNDKVSTPYLAHLNLGKKGYQVPRRGTIQVTLLNPLGTVVKMFVVLYDLSDMPPRSHTFLRQRTLRDKTLRYLIHLRFMSGKSGRIYLHTDIRIIICRKSDVDTASEFGSEPPRELRSYIHGPTNPKFSPRC